MQEECEKKFKEINEAYHVLCDEKKRESYDNTGGEATGSSPQWNPASHMGSPEFSFFSNMGGAAGGRIPFARSSSRSGHAFRNFGGMDDQGIFGSMFQNIFSGLDSTSSRGFSPFESSAPEIEKTLFCTLEEVFRGCRKTLRLRDVILGEEVQRDVVIDVKPGWKAGTRIKFSAIPSFPVTVVFVLQLLPHSYLELSGLNLKYKCTLTSGQLQRGVSIKVPMIDGSVLVYNTSDLNAQIKNGTTKVFPQLGMISSKIPSQRGDFQIIFSVTP